MARLSPRLRTTLVTAAAGAAVLGAAAGAVLGPSGPWLVDSFADGQKAWRLGRLRVDGVRGWSLGHMQAARITLADEEGVWAEIENADIRWRPLNILFGDVRIDAATASRIHILRQPVLSAPAPPRGPRFDVFIDALNAPRIDLDQPVADIAASFRLDLALSYDQENITRLAVDLARTDSDLDRAEITFAIDGRALTFAAQVTGEPGGVFANALGVEDQVVRFDGDADGDLDTGDATIAARVGDTQALTAQLAWRERTWTAAANANLAAAPIFADWRQRLGDGIALEGSGVQLGRYDLRAIAPNAVLTLASETPPRWPVQGPTNITLQSASLARLVPELNIGGGAARVEGVVSQQGDETQIAGTLTTNDVTPGGQRISLAGPARARLDLEQIRFDAQLGVTQAALALYERATLNLDLVYDRQRERTELRRTTLEGPNVQAVAQGHFVGGQGEFSGDWRVRRLQAFAPQLVGNVAGRWRARTDDTAGWLITVDGRGAGISGQPEFAPDLLGAAPTLDAQFAIKDSIITVSHARVNGAQLRAGATGFIRDGNANLALEASARGPVRFGTAVVEGAADMTGRITGDLGHPRVDATAQLASVDLSGVLLEQPLVTISLAPVGAQDYRGTVAVEGHVSGQAARAQSEIAIDRAGVSFPTLDAEIGALTAQGSARIAEAGLTADVALGGAIDNLVPGASGAVEGTAILRPETLSIEATLANARLGDLRMRTATVSATGPYDNIAARFALRGALNRAPLTFEGQGALTSARGATEARFTGQGALAGAPLVLREETRARWREGALEASLNAQIGDGALALTWRENGRTLAAEARMERAPIAPIAAIWGERAQGAMSGTGNIGGNGGLTGALDLTLDDARFASRTQETLNGRVVARLTPDRLTGTIDARSSDGLTAHFEADAPVQTSAAPFRIAITPQRFGTASWSVDGPVGGLWSAARLNDQLLSGNVEGEGSMRFGAGSLTGEGELAISGGAFEDKLSGVKLQNIDALVRFGANGAQIERFNATDSRGGTLTASGGAATPREGRIEITMRDLRLVDRPDARAVASGDLALEWEGLTSRLSGDINLSEGSVSIATSPAAALPQLDVIEINRPGEEDMPMDEAPRAARGQATTLDVRVRAPGRIFTRGRGVDAEWSLNLRLAGNLADPRIVGTARTVRGDLTLSGRAFEITSGLISFNGDPLEAVLDIVAEREATDLTARIHLTGTPNDPEIALSSTPALPEEEILPQVMFGRSVADLSALEAAQLASSLAALSGQASFDLAEAARSISGLDRLDVREDENGGFLVAGGVYLTRDVYVEVQRTGLGEAATRVEWRVRPRLLLITSFLPEGDQRASIRWRREMD